MAPEKQCNLSQMPHLLPAGTAADQNAIKREMINHERCRYLCCDQIESPGAAIAKSAEQK